MKKKTTKTKRRRKMQRQHVAREADQLLRGNASVLTAQKVKEVEEEDRSRENLESFLDTHGMGIVTYPNGTQRNLREEFDYADKSLTIFGSLGMDKKANMEILNQNITFMVWRTVVFQTDIDTKDILIKPETAQVNDVHRSLFHLLNVATQTNFKNTNFGSYLNDLRERALKYGTVISKVAGGDVQIIPWHAIKAYDWMVNENEVPRIAQEIELPFQKALDRFEGHPSLPLIQQEIAWLRDNKFRTIRFLEFWDEHYIDGAYQDGAVLYLSRDYLADVSQEAYDRYKMTGSEAVYTEVDRYVSDYKVTRHGKTIYQRPFFELSFINPASDACRIGFGIPVLVEAVQKEWTEKAHMKRKADRLAYKSVWIHKRRDGGNVDENVRQQMSKGIETGALLEISEEENLERLTIASPIQNFMTDIPYLESIALKIVGTAQLSAQEQSANKTATQAQIEAGREQTSINYFIEKQGLMLEKMLMVYLKEVLLQLTEQDIMMLFGNPKDIREIRKMLFSVHYRENYKSLNRKFQKITGERPWLKDLDALYAGLDQQLEKVFGTDTLPFRFKKWKKKIVAVLDFMVDVDVTTENNIDQQIQEIYKLMLQLPDPEINKQKVTKKILATTAHGTDTDLYYTPEEMKERQEQDLIAQAKAQMAQQIAQQGAGAEPQQEEEDANPLTPTA